MKSSNCTMLRPRGWHRLIMAGNGEVLVDRRSRSDLRCDCQSGRQRNQARPRRRTGRCCERNCERHPGISVSDNGPGIPADQHEQVFKRFYPARTSRYTPGNGLGLSFVAAVARLHGARIECSITRPASYLNSGSRHRASSGSRLHPHHDGARPAPSQEPTWLNCIGQFVNASRAAVDHSAFALNPNVWEWTGDWYSQKHEADALKVWICRTS